MFYRYLTLMEGMFDTINTSNDVHGIYYIHKPMDATSTKMTQMDNKMFFLAYCHYFKLFQQ